MIYTSRDLRVSSKVWGKLGNWKNGEKRCLGRHEGSAQSYGSIWNLRVFLRKMVFQGCHLDGS